MFKAVRKMSIMCVLAFVLCFCGCEPIKDSEGEIENISIKLTVSYPEYENTFFAEGKFETVEDVMNFLVEGEQFTFTASNGDYGLFIMEVCGYTVSGNEFWGVYTDTITYDKKGLPNVYEEYTEVVGGKTFYFCALGVSGQKVYNGENVLLVVGSF